MSWEEDFLLAKTQELEQRIAKLEELCPGFNSQISEENSTNITESNEKNLQQPAQMTENPSKNETESSIVSLTDTNTQETQIPSISDKKEVWVEFARNNNYPGNPNQASKQEIVEWWDELQNP